MKRIAINGFGRMGRLALRAAFPHPDLEVVAVNETGADARTMALLLERDSVQGRWHQPCRAGAGGSSLVVGERELAFLSVADPADLDWAGLGVDVVLECTGERRTPELLAPHLERGAKHVLVSAPVADPVPNIVVGVNHDAFDLSEHRITSAASCTTNALAPIVHVLHRGLGIERGVVTTIHDPTGTQRVVDSAHRDPRRARASQLSLIPTSTNSATAVTRILPELAGKLDSIAVRAPVLNASLVDAVFHVARPTTVEEVNGLLEAAAKDAALEGILGYETEPLVSVDYAGDPRSSVVDALSTRVTDGTLVKVLAWYDNEWGYANRMVELCAMVIARGTAVRG